VESKVDWVTLVGEVHALVRDCPSFDYICLARADLLASYVSDEHWLSLDL
jgi:hypothetical protein